MTAAAGPEAQIRTGLLIGGETVETADSFPVHDPAAPDRVVGHAAAATREHTRRAVDAAQEAWPDWSGRDPQQRAEILTEALGALDSDSDQRTDLLVLENGKVRAEAAVEMSVFAQRCRLAAGLAEELRTVHHHPWASHADMVSTGGGAGASGADDGVPRFRTEVSRMPLGVVTIIVPFNWPLAILAASLPHALVAGNTVIVKPPPTTPLSVVRTLERLAQRLPAGVLNVVTGDNEGVAPALQDPRIRRIVFTGSTNAGRAIMSAATENMTRVTLELGGNDPAVLLDDVELDDVAVTRLVEGAFLTTGQVCMGIKRVYVPRSRFDELVARLSDALEEYRVGHGLAPESTMGPLNSAKQRDFVRGLMDDARSAGREVREFGTLSDEARESGGHFLRPALVLDPGPRERITVEEQFGPVLPVIAYDDLDEAVDAVNHDWSGLCSSVWSADHDRAADLAARLRTGTTWVNDANAVAQDDRAPFGGLRQSGMGRELGVEGLLEMTEAHTVTYTRRP
ncbi:aldehyde dehydrogenase family protein [Streptomonospora algeriensis]|uniref:Aldehyde dehydrogenase family protein n=1 Tax=Streptomonospora algeriensis TaxID=995084 RepID=A0ABW3BL04_9ACTN